MKFLLLTSLFVACCGASTIDTLEEVQVEELDLVQPCPVVCPALYSPICGFDGAEYKEFDNMCLLKVNNCERKQERSLMKPFAQTDIDWCSTKLLDNIYDLFNKMDVDINKPDCLKACPMIYQPVCVSNGEYRGTIANACLLNQVNCLLNGTKLASTIFRVLSSQKCEQD